jgi:hypothetical protein
MDWEAAAHIASSLALILAIIVFLWQVYAQWRQRKYERSMFHLKSAIDGFSQAIALLSDGNNDRIIWNSAARILERATRVAKKIKLKVHRDVFEIQLEKYRKELADVLGYHNAKKNAPFFEGTRAHIGEGEIREISESALWTIWRNAQFPQDYEDPISGKFPDDVVWSETKRIMWPGLIDYLRKKGGGKKDRP